MPLRLVLALMAVAGSLLLASGHRLEARASTLPACSLDYATQPATDARLAGRAVVGVTALGTWGEAPCLLRDRLTFTVQPASDRFSPHGVIGSIEGNSAKRVVNVVLKPGSVLVYSWRWSNWCGAARRFILQAFWNRLGYTTPSQTVRPPACTRKGSRSTLAERQASVPACSGAAYRVRTGLGQPFMTKLIDVVEITPRKRHLPCLLRRVQVHFAVQGAMGSTWTTLSTIRGNPAKRIVGAMLTQTYGGFDVFWAWSNWCGGGDRFRAFARVAARPTAGPTETQGATCEGSGAPSTLSPSYGHL